MEIVLDSNILFSALISGKEIYIDILRSLEVYVPDFIFNELSKYQKRIIKKNRLEDEFIFFVKELFSEITVIPKFAISRKSYEVAASLCDGVDPKDSAFLALSIEFDVPLWTNDKKLIQGLAAKGYKKIITTEEIFEQALMNKKRSVVADPRSLV
jgi:predicted nucleic acid-binding protein